MVDAKKRSFGGVLLLAGVVLAANSHAQAPLNNPWSLCVADLNGDGLSDLIAANNAGGLISVFINQGALAFAQVDYPGGAQGRHCAVADLNGDNVPDVVIASNDANRGITVMLNDGQGNFDLTYYGTAFGTGTGVWSVAIADVNADGAPDLVVASAAGGGIIAVLLNDGTGQFAPADASPFSSGTDSRFVALFDTNGDGLLDAVVSNYSVNRISVLEGNGDGTFGNRTQFPIGAGDPNDHPNQMAIGDFNNDGILDLVHSCHGNLSADTVFWPGNGDGTFGDHLLSDTRDRPEAMAGPVDFDGDGNLDVVIGSDVEGFRVEFGDGNGQFTRKPKFDLGVRVRAIGIGDLDGDGIPDLAIAPQRNPSSLMIYLNDGAGNFRLQ